MTTTRMTHSLTGLHTQFGDTYPVCITIYNLKYHTIRCSRYHHSAY